MLTDQDSLGFCPEDFHDYLLLLARMWLPRHLQRTMDASDLVQVTHTKAFGKAQQFRGASEAQYKAWLRQILRNTLLDALKRHGPEKSVSQFSESSSRLEQRLAGDEPTPSTRAVLQEQLDRIATLLSQLPEDQQQALVMKYCLGLRVAQIAADLDRSTASVAGLLRRGLKQLRSQFAEQ